MQMRLIMAAEQSLHDADQFLGTCNSQEGLKAATDNRIKALISKIDNKIDKDAKVENLSAENTLKDGDETHDLHIKGSHVVLGLNTAKVKLNALREVILCMQCKEEAAIESSSAYLMRCYKDALACNVALPSSVLAEVARRQVLAALATNNIDDAVRALSLDPENGGTSSLGAWTGNDSTKKNMQAEISFDALVFILSRDSGAVQDEADLKEMAAKLPTIVDNPGVTVACLHLARVANPSAFQDSEVLESVAALQDPAKVSEMVAKKVLIGRGKELIGSARSLVVQRGIDTSLVAELTGIKEGLVGFSPSPPTKRTEEALVAAICEAKELGKKKVRLQGVLQKMSQETQSAKSADISFCNKALRSRGGVLGDNQVSAFWAAMQKPLGFISKAPYR